MSDMPDYASKIIRDLPDWRVILAEDIDIYAEAQIASGGFSIVLQYTVPAGKMLLIYDWSAINNENTEPIAAHLAWSPLGAFIGAGGGSPGFQTPFSKPKRIAAGKTVSVEIAQYSGALRWVVAHIGGVLI